VQCTLQACPHRAHIWLLQAWCSLAFLLSQGQAFASVQATVLRLTRPKFRLCTGNIPLAFLILKVQAWRDYTVPRVPECLSPRPNWIPPEPPLRPAVRLPPLELGGGGQHSLAGEGAGEASYPQWKYFVHFQLLVLKAPPGKVFAILYSFKRIWTSCY
jgi:hypothetical protein